MRELYIGLMSGTSMDGIDAALVEFGDASVDILQTRDHPYPDELRQRLLAAISVPLDREIQDLADLDRDTGTCFRDAASALLLDAGVDSSAVKAIGSHGQTLRHQPNAEQAFSLQIGDPKIIATGNGITTVADFRSADLAVGGQGAPLAPAFHEWLFRSPGKNRCILNIGGVANVTVIADGHATIGFDTGPGNSLMDAWTRLHRNEPYDRDGRWASKGVVDKELLVKFLSDPYFASAPPKSTGFEHFNLRWIEAHDIGSIDPCDVQASLCALSAATIADAVKNFAFNMPELLVCGGGVHNRALMHELATRLPGVSVSPTSAAGLDPDWVEAAAFAWLAMRRLHGLPGNLPSVTGANAAVQLGTIHSPD
ncbi:MAG: anhydro-N-acetylmuramic acid kinase [Woeseiaceae bacterium]